MRCPICELDFKSYTAVSLHYRNKHGTSIQFRETMRQKYIDENHGGVTPVCKCGCGQTPKYYDYERGYVEFVRGHAARVNNNWGHNATAQKKSQDVRSEMHKRGEIFIWNKDKTKETDERVAALGRKGSETLKTDPECQKQRSEHMSHQWSVGDITPLTGRNHPNWKGGTSALQPICRSRIFNKWAVPKLETARYVCQACFARDGRSVVVHHDKERFAEILHKAIAVHGEIDPSAPDDDFEKKSVIADWVLAYHLDNNVSGMVLCESCHEIAHSNDN